MAELIFAEEILAHLVTLGLAQVPTASGDLPRCWIEPLEGVPPLAEDDEDATMHVGIFNLPEVAMPTFEDPLTQRPIKFVTRCKDWPATEAFHKALRATFEEQRLYMAGALLVQRSKMAVGIQRVPDADPTVYQATQTFRFTAFVSDTTV